MKQLSITFFILLLFSFSIFAQTPQTISFQGVATDIAGTNLPDGNYMMIFKMYESETGGSSIWSETQNVSVTNGIFNVLLGSVEPFALPFDQQYWLSVKIESDPELDPRIPLTSSPYSFIANTVPDGAITQDKLSPDLSIPPGGSAGGDLTGEFPNPTIANNAVTTDKIANHAVTEDKLSTQIHLGGLIAITEKNVSCTSLGNVDDTFVKLMDLVTFQKNESESTIIATFYGRIYLATMTGSGANFELRIDDEASTVSYARAEIKSAEVEAGQGLRTTISGVFEDLPAGSHTVSIWVRVFYGTGTNAMIDPGCWSSNKISVMELK